MESNELVHDYLQQLAVQGQIPVSMVTGFSMIVEGVNEEGIENLVLVCSPYTYFTKAMGHARYLTIALDKLVEPQDY